MSGTPAAWQSLLTCLLASAISQRPPHRTPRPFKTPLPRGGSTSRCPGPASRAQTQPVQDGRRPSAHSPMLSSAFITSPKPLIHSKSFCASLTFPCRAWMLIPLEGLKCRADAAATSALDLDMSGLRKRNWRFKLDRSIVSRSICRQPRGLPHWHDSFPDISKWKRPHTISILAKPTRTRFLTADQCFDS